jgi:hypothetical protein
MARTLKRTEQTRLNENQNSRVFLPPCSLHAVKKLRKRAEAVSINPVRMSGTGGRFPARVRFDFAHLRFVIGGYNYDSLHDGFGE